MLVGGKAAEKACRSLEVSWAAVSLGQRGIGDPARGCMLKRKVREYAYPGCTRLERNRPTK